jgi:hypothetical protein
MRKNTKACVVLVLLLLVGVVLGLRWLLSSQRLRRNWKDQAVIEVSRIATNRSWVNERTAAIQKQALAGSQGTWLGDSIVVMRDGEWIIFRNECGHRHQLLGDIFIGKASNGRWYYSSFHFCCEMVVPKMDEQPTDLSSFITKHFLREFDGKSDDAIQQTWAHENSPMP